MFHILLCASVCAGCGGTVDIARSGDNGGRRNTDAGASAGHDGSIRFGGQGGIGGGGLGDGGTVIGAGGTISGSVDSGVHHTGSGGWYVEPFDASGVDPETVACHRMSGAMQPCAGSSSSEREAARLTARFVVACRAEFDLPGVTRSASDLEACAVATRASSCGLPDGPPLECDFRGSFAGGAPCILGIQCASGQCLGTGPLISPGGPVPGAVGCGTCGGVVKIGDSCDGPNGCPKGSICFASNTSAANPTYRCTALTVGGEGSHCEAPLALCRPGLYCRSDTSSCAPLGKLGEPCAAYSGNGCITPLVCRGTPKTCEAPSLVGAACSSFDFMPCEAGADCSDSGKCETITWGDLGSTCDSRLQRCGVGACPMSLFGHTSGTCTLPIEDGKLCSISSDCDVGSSCVNASAVGAATGICQPLATAVCP